MTHQLSEAMLNRLRVAAADHPEPAGEAFARIRAEGYQAGLTGSTTYEDNPHTDRLQRLAWSQGHNAGRARRYLNEYGEQ